MTFNCQNFRRTFFSSFIPSANKIRELTLIQCRSCIYLSKLPMQKCPSTLEETYHAEMSEYIRGNLPCRNVRVHQRKLTMQKCPSTLEETYHAEMSEYISSKCRFKSLVSCVILYSQQICTSRKSINQLPKRHQKIFSQ